MKLSQLMLEGCIGTTQEFNQMIVVIGGRCSCCALGAILLGLVRRQLASLAMKNPEDFLWQEFPELASPPPNDLPENWNTEVVSLADAIVYLNDRGRWTREQIADYLQSLGY